MYTLKIQSFILSILDDTNIELVSSKILELEIELKIYGIYGIIHFNGSDNLIVITEAKIHNLFSNKEIYEIKNVEVFCLNGKINLTLKKMIKDFFRLPGMYFSQQNIHQRTNNNTDNTFLFNSVAAENYKRFFKGKGIYPLINCIQGYIGKYKELLLIARRCPRRSGTRYFSRGLDKEGYPSNFVEIEQLIEGKSSYLQIRGSIPLYWRQNLGYIYNPRFEVISTDGIEISDKVLNQIYKSKIIYLNLIHEYGKEGTLFKVYDQELKANKIPHYNYNFKNNIRSSKFPFNFKESGFTSNEEKQEYIIRTNCIDCLDRTNSMQSLIGRDILELQLDDLKLIDSIKRKEYYKELLKMYEKCGDMLSIQYAGTKAMSTAAIGIKSDSVIGPLKDLYLGISRYIINRKTDGELQNSYEIVTGQKTKGHLEKGIIASYKVMFLIIFLLSILLAKSKLHNIRKIVKTILFSVILYVLLNLIKINYPVKLE